ncbi:MAG: ABC transporter substrate-binding protein [Gaiellaceae bacterium]
MKAAVLAVAAGLLLVGTACGERSEPTGAHLRIYPVTVHGAGERPAVVRSAPQRIVPIGPGPRSILSALGLGKRVVPVDDSLVGLPLVDRIRHAHPDLIVASGEADPLDLARARAATHAAVYVEADGSLDDVAGSIDDIGLLTGKPVVARRLSGSLEQTGRRVAARVKGSAPVSAFVDLGGFTTVSSRSLIGDLIAKAGGQNVAGPAPEQGPFPLKRLVQLDPEAYVAIGAGTTTLARLRAGARTKRIRAVRNGRFGVVESRLVVPGPRLGAALVQIARILHPNAFR